MVTRRTFLDCAHALCDNTLTNAYSLKETACKAEPPLQSLGK